MRGNDIKRKDDKTTYSGLIDKIMNADSDETKKERFKIQAMLILVASACIVTFYAHVIIGTGRVFSHLFYLPIILSAIWWKKKGLYITAFLILILITSHILFRDHVPITNDLLRSLMFIIVASITTFLSENIVKSKNALQENKERYRALFENMSDGVVVLRPVDNGKNFVFTDFNKAGEEIENISRDSLIDKNIHETQPNLKDSGLIDVFQRVYATGESEHHPVATYEHKRISGWRENHVFKSPSGEIVSVFRDETEKKKAEEKKVHFNSLMRLTHNINQIIAKEKDPKRLIQNVCDLIVKNQECHSAWIALMDNMGKVNMIAEAGFSKGIVSRIYQQNQNEMPLCGMMALSQKDIIKIKDPRSTCKDCPMSMYSNSDGTLTVRLEYRGKIYGIVSVSLDREWIADSDEQELFKEAAGDIAFALHAIEHEERRRNAEEALRKSEANYRVIFDAINQPIFVQDIENGSIVDVNQKACDMYGYSKEEFFQIPSGAVSTHMSPYSLDDALERFKLTSEGQPQLYEWIAKKKNGDEFWIEVNTQRVIINGCDRLLSFMRDISEQKKAEKDLSESYQRQQYILEGVAIPAFIIGKDHRVVYWNKAMEEISGIKARDVTGKRYFWESMYNKERSSLADLVVDELFDEVPLWYKDNYKESPLMEGAYEAVDFFPLLGEKGKWLRFTVSPLRDSMGNIVEAMETVEDISAAMFTEEALRESERSLETVIQGLPIPAFVMNKNHDIIYWNKAMEEMSGIKADEVMFSKNTKRPWMALYNEEKPILVDLLVDQRFDEIHEIFSDKVHKSLLIDEAYELIDYFPGVGGKNKWLKITAATLRDFGGDIMGAVETIEDITERRSAEDAVLESEQKLQNILESFPNPIFVIDREHRVTYWNKAIENMSGTKAADAIGAVGAWKPFYGIERTSLADVIVDESFDDIFKNYAEKVEMSSSVAGAYTASDFFEAMNGGAGKWLQFTAAPLRNLRGEIIGAVETIEDISDKKHAEEMLEAQMRALEISNAELEKFAYVASHDLQEPLRMVASYMQLLSRRYKDRLDEDANEFIDYAVDGAKRMKLLINDLLAYSRVGTMGKDFEPTDVDKLLEVIIMNLQAAIAENEAIITHDPLPIVQADGMQLAQLLQNLIINAIKYRSDELPRIHVSAEKRGREWIFLVKDNGIGIDPQFSERIFEIFQRLHGSGKGYTGTGIGLAICKKIVDRHGGEIWVESKPEEGAVFYFTIPDEKGLNPVI